MFKRTGAKLRRDEKTQQKRPDPVLKSPREIQIMREAGRIVARVHAALREAIRPGVSTLDLDRLAVDVMSRYNATSCFLGYRGFPANICASINNELVHGIPNRDRVLKEGDIISIDVGVRYRGFIGDSAWTYAVGAISAETQRLMQVTEASLYEGIAQSKTGNRVIDISRAVQRYVESHGMSVVREYTGHGVGPADARGAAGAQLRQRRQRRAHVAAPRLGGGHRTDGAGGDMADAHAQGQLDRGQQRRQHGGPFRAHSSNYQFRAGNFDAALTL
jgi:methionine aminopeptidase type I